MNYISMCAENPDAYDTLPSMCEDALQSMKRSMAGTNIAMATQGDVNIIFVEFHAFSEASLSSLSQDLKQYYHDNENSMFLIYNGTANKTDRLERFSRFIKDNYLLPLLPAQQCLYVDVYNICNKDVSPGERGKEIKRLKNLRAAEECDEECQIMWKRYNQRKRMSIYRDIVDKIKTLTQSYIQWVSPNTAAALRLIDVHNARIKLVYTDATKGALYSESKKLKEKQVIVNWIGERARFVNFKKETDLIFKFAVTCMRVRSRQNLHETNISHYCKDMTAIQIIAKDIEHDLALFRKTAYATTIGLQTLEYGRHLPFRNEKNTVAELVLAPASRSIGKWLPTLPDIRSLIQWSSHIIPQLSTFTYIKEPSGLRTIMQESFDAIYLRRRHKGYDIYDVPLKHIRFTQPAVSNASGPFSILEDAQKLREGTLIPHGGPDVPMDSYTPDSDMTEARILDDYVKLIPVMEVGMFKDSFTNKSLLFSFDNRRLAKYYLGCSGNTQIRIKFTNSAPAYYAKYQSEQSFKMWPLGVDDDVGKCLAIMTNTLPGGLDALKNAVYIDGRTDKSALITAFHWVTNNTDIIKLMLEESSVRHIQQIVANKKKSMYFNDPFYEMKTSVMYRTLCALLGQRLADVVGSESEDWFEPLRNFILTRFKVDPSAIDSIPKLTCFLCEVGDNSHETTLDMVED